MNTAAIDTGIAGLTRASRMRFRSLRRPFMRQTGRPTTQPKQTTAAIASAATNKMQLSLVSFPALWNVCEIVDNRSNFLKQGEEQDLSTDRENL